jgi:hypothetical protein
MIYEGFFSFSEKRSPLKGRFWRISRMEEQTTLVDDPVEYEVILDEEGEESGSESIAFDWEDQLYEQARDKEMMKEEAEK